MKNYLIDDIIPGLVKQTGYYVGYFEDTPDPDIKWLHTDMLFILVIWFIRGDGNKCNWILMYKILPNRILLLIQNKSTIGIIRLIVVILLLVDEHLAKHLNFGFFLSPFFGFERQKIFCLLKKYSVRMLTDNNQLPCFFTLFGFYLLPEAEYRKIRIRLLNTRK